MPFFFTRLSLQNVSFSSFSVLKPKQNTGNNDAEMEGEKYLKSNLHYMMGKEKVKMVS